MTSIKVNKLVILSLVLVAVLQIRTIKLDLPYRFLEDEWYFYLSAINIWKDGKQLNPLYPPLGPYALGVVYKVMDIIGGNPEISALATATHLAGRLVSVFVTLLGCSFMFQVGKLAFNAITGLAMMGLYAVDPFVFDMGHTIRGDPFAFMFVTASLFFTLRALKHPGKQRLIWYATITMIFAILGKYSVAPLAVFPAYLWLRRFVPSTRHQIVMGLTLFCAFVGLLLAIRTLAQPLRPYFEKSGFLFIFNQDLFSLARLQLSLSTITALQPKMFLMSALCLTVLALLFWRRMNSVQQNLYSLLILAVLGTSIIFLMTEARYRDIFVIPYSLFILWSISAALVTESLLSPRLTTPILLVGVLVFAVPGYLRALQESNYLRQGDNRVLVAKWLEQNVNQKAKIFKEYDPGDFLPHISGYQGGYLPWEGKSGLAATIFDHTPEEWWDRGVMYVIADDRTTGDWFDPSNDRSKYDGFTLAYQTPPGNRPGPRMAVFYTFRIQTQVNFRFADAAQLYGYHINERNLCLGKQFISRLFIRSLKVMDTNYQTIIAFRDPVTGQLVSSQSQIPMMGQRPTTVWEKYELVFDDHWIDMPAALKPGKYAVEMAFYDPDHGRRLDVYDSAGSPAGDSVSMGQITYSSTCNPNQPQD